MGLCIIVATSSLLGIGNTLLNFLYVAIGLGTVIFVHELGHFLVAKYCGVKCEKFYVGFDVPIKIFGIRLPAAFWKRQWGETEYGVGVIPLGGYVKMLGQDDNPANYEAETERTRVRKKPTDATASEPETSADAADDRDTATPADAEDKASTAPAAAASGVPSDAPAAQDTDQRTSSAPTEDQQQTADDQTTDNDAPGGVQADADEYEVDPRSFTAKSVPKRMAIISAGVIMNVIFAVIFATLAFRVGVPHTPCVVGETHPGTAAWEADAPLGSRIVQIGKNGTESWHLRFEMDLLQNIGLTGGLEDLWLLFQDGDEEDKKTWIALRPRPLKYGSDKRPRIGIRAAPSMRLAGSEKIPPVFPHQPAARAETPFLPRDTLVAVKVGGTRIDVPDFVAFREVLARHPEDELTIVVERIVKTQDETIDPENPKTEELEIKVKANPMRRVGLVMTMGPIESIQRNSPAAQAGIKVGDELKTINGQEVVDPLVLPQMLRRLAGQEVTIGVIRDEESLEFTLTPRQPRMHPGHWTSGSILGVDPLGIAIPVLNRVHSVESGSAAAEAGMQAGDELLSAQFVAVNDEAKKEEEDAGLGHKSIDLGELRNWLYVHDWMQMVFPETKLKLEYRRGEEKRESLLLPVRSDELFVVDRGFRLESASETHVANSWGEAFSLGLRNTGESLMLVFRFLRKLVTNQISPTNLGGPIAIFAVAGHEADAGISRLLLFLTLLSANLAIINFLPIPVLDGGHMVFLLYEGIQGKPVNELWAMRLTVAGLVFILTLMAFVIGLDIYRFTSMWLS